MTYSRTPLPTDVSYAPSLRLAPLASASDARGSLASSRSGISGIVDKGFALTSILLVAAACVVAMRVWIEPSWHQIPVLALIYLLVRGLLWCLFEPKGAS